VAAAVGKSPAAVRQIAHRARAHVEARRPRVHVDRAEQEAVIERFLAALTNGDVQGLLDVLAPDVRLVADGGGVVNAAPVPIVGATPISRLLSKFAKRGPAGAVARPMRVNGAPGAAVEVAGAVDTAISFVVEDGRITRIYAVRNPHKLGWLAQEAALAR
jgi:RNA polymerase sigma-70 factor (ECF subfamily)